MDNKSISRKLKLIIQLMELHEENPFKIRSYQNAVITIDRAGLDIAGMEPEDLQEIKGIGKSLADVIATLVRTQTHPYLEELLQKTPEGLLEVLQIKGLGPKKIKVLWKDLNVTSTHELMEACQSGQVAKLKGFGERTQIAIVQAMEYTEANKGKWLYAEIGEVVLRLQQDLERHFGNDNVALTGDYSRNIEVLDHLDWVIESADGKADWEKIKQIPLLLTDLKSSSPFKCRANIKDVEIPVNLYFTPPNKFIQTRLMRTGSREHLLSPVGNDNQTLAGFFKSKSFDSEMQAYEEAGLSFIPAELREGQFEIQMAKEGKLPVLLEMEDLKGSLHNHSTYSDGKHSLREMAEQCKFLGYEYLGIADHSKSAFYAGGLDIDQVLKQQKEILMLNEEMAPFKIFSGIESDILNDGSLDYPDEVLAGFDFVVSSIHTSLGMSRQKATQRLLTAIHNPYTTILGHPTGRLLLRRDGYPIDHKIIIDACASKMVVIEINANPWRLDLDWRWVHYALDKGVKLSINPDAHEKEAFHDMKYGVLVGRKGGLTKGMTLNAMPLKELEIYFAERRTRKTD